MQRAKHSRLKVPDETLNGALQDIAQRNNIPLSQLPEALPQQGIDYAAYREDMRKELTLGLLRQRDVHPAHQRHAARDRPVPREAAKNASEEPTSTTSRTS